MAFALDCWQQYAGEHEMRTIGQLKLQQESLMLGQSQDLDHNSKGNLARPSIIALLRMITCLWSCSQTVVLHIRNFQ